MEEKVKVNISHLTFEILKKDMELFEYYKPDGSLNKNLFYNTLIVNYYETYYKKEEKVIKIKQH